MNTITAGEILNHMKKYDPSLPIIYDTKNEHGDEFRINKLNFETICETPVQTFYKTISDEANRRNPISRCINREEYGLVHVDGDFTSNKSVITVESFLKAFDLEYINPDLPVFFDRWGDHVDVYRIHTITTTYKTTVKEGSWLYMHLIDLKPPVIEEFSPMFGRVLHI